ncbi:MAG: phage tail protein [Bacteroidetes bacterium]|nr:phage tail protein [Bacteroidota bacterium]
MSNNPYMAFNFYILLIDTSSLIGMISTGINAFTAGGFSECTGLGGSLTVEEYNEGGVNEYVHKFPTRMTYGNLTLKRGMAFTDDLWNWHYDYASGKGSRRDGIIAMLGPTRDPVRVWSFKRGLPLKWTGPSFNAQQSAVAVETIEIAHEGLELISGGTVLGDIGSAFVSINPS